MTLVVEAGRFVDVEAGVVLDDRRIVVEGERVSAVLAPGEQLPPGCEVLDLTDCTVLPGMIDLHTHLVGPTEDGDLAAVLDRSPASEALLGVVNARATLEAGFTAVRDVGSYWAFVDVELRRAIDAGVVVGPRMHCAGAYITCRGGGGEVTGVPEGREVPAELRVGVVDSADDVRRAAERIFAGGADLLKLIATGAVLAPETDPGEPELTEEQIRVAVQVAADHGAFVAAHAHGAAGAKRAARAGVRSVEHGSLIDEEALDVMGEHGTWLVADVYNGDYINETGERDGWPEELMRKNRETTETQRVAFSRAVERGNRLAFGTDAGVYPHGANARQLPIMVRLGMTPIGAVQAATIRAAECLGRDDLGVLAPSRFADLVAVAGHDLGDLSVLQSPALVMKGGQVVADRRTAAS
jgi:imidazolonepropionase-like amidohydrolase